MIRLYVPEQTPTANELRRAYRHWAAYQRLIERWTLLLLEAKGRRHIPEASTPMTVSVHRSYQARRFDDEGLVGGFKPVLDLLTRPRGKAKPYGFGWIVDDHPKWLPEPIHILQVKSADAWTTIILAAAERGGGTR